MAGKSKEDQLAEKKQELEKRLQDVSGQLGTAKKATKKADETAAKVDAVASGRQSSHLSSSSSSSDSSSSSSSDSSSSDSSDSEAGKTSRKKKEKESPMGGNMTNIPVTSTPITSQTQQLPNNIQSTAPMVAIPSNPSQLPSNNAFQIMNNPLMNMALQNNSKIPSTNLNIQQFPSQPHNNMAPLPPVSLAANSMKLDPITLQNPLLKQQQLQQQLKSNAGLPNNKLGNAALMQQMGMMAGTTMMNMVSIPGGGGMAPNGTNNMHGLMDNKVPIPQMIPSVLNDKSMSLLSNFDEVEQSLASMEQPNQLKAEMDPMNMDLLSDMNLIMAKSSQDQSLMQQLGFDNSMQSGAHDGGNNGFGVLDSNLGLNGVGSTAGGPRNNSMMMGMQSMSHLNSQTGLMPSIFDPITTPISRSISMTGSTNNLPPTSIGSGGGNGESNATGPSTGGFRPKPIEELLQNHDKKTPPPQMDKSGGHAANASNKNNLASSWSSLAAASSPQNTPTSTKPKQQQHMDSFQQYRIKVKEKIEKQRMLEQQEMRRSHKEAAEKRQQQEHQQKLKRDEVDAIRKPAVEPIARVVDELKSSPLGSGSPTTPAPSSDRAAAKRAELRRIEQERRRREAMAGQIDMNMQSDLMAEFEESFESRK